MASVAAKSSGSRFQEVEANTVSEARKALGLPETYSAVVNGTPASDGDTLEENQVVIFSQKTKGA